MSIEAHMAADQPYDDRDARDEPLLRVQNRSYPCGVVLCDLSWPGFICPICHDWHNHLANYGPPAEGEIRTISPTQVALFLGGTWQVFHDEPAAALRPLLEAREREAYERGRRETATDAMLIRLDAAEIAAHNAAIERAVEAAASVGSVPAMDAIRALKR